MRWLLTIISLFALAISVSVPAWAFDKRHYKKFWALNGCMGCDLSEAKLGLLDLSEANLRRADLSEADLSTATLWNAKLDGAILWKTEAPWGEENSGC